MRAVADTNVVVSGLLWGGPPRQILDAADAGDLELFTSVVLLAELEDVLSRDKFATRLETAKMSARQLILGYAALADLVEPAEIEPVVEADPDDDAVLACAVAANARVIASGDRHLLDLGGYEEIEILTAAELLALLQESDAHGS